MLPSFVPTTAETRESESKINEICMNFSWHVELTLEKPTPNNNKFICLIITTHLAPIVLRRRRNSSKQNNETFFFLEQRRNGKRKIDAPDVGHFKNRFANEQRSKWFSVFSANALSRSAIITFVYELNCHYPFGVWNKLCVPNVKTLNRLLCFATFAHFSCTFIGPLCLCCENFRRAIIFNKFKSFCFPSA